jgi:hypothetical protein
MRKIFLIQENNILNLEEQIIGSHDWYYNIYGNKKDLLELKKTTVVIFFTTDVVVKKHIWSINMRVNGTRALVNFSMCVNKYQHLSPVSPFLVSAWTHGEGRV